MQSSKADAEGDRAASQNRPNPFNPTTTIGYAVSERVHVSLRVYDAAGRLVRTLANEVQDARAGYEVAWDGRDDAGGALPSGVYFYRLTIGENTESKKMLMLK